MLLVCSNHGISFPYLLHFSHSTIPWSYICCITVNCIFVHQKWFHDLLQKCYPLTFTFFFLPFFHNMLIFLLLMSFNFFRIFHCNYNDYFRLCKLYLKCLPLWRWKRHRRINSIKYKCTISYAITWRFKEKENHSNKLFNSRQKSSYRKSTCTSIK